MRILLISPCIVPVRRTASAGIEAVLYALSDALNDRCQEIHMAATADSVLATGVMLHACDSSAFDVEVPRIIRRLNPDIICNHSCRTLESYDHLPWSFSVYHVSRKYQESDSKETNIAFVSDYLLRSFESERGCSYRQANVIQNGIMFPLNSHIGHESRRDLIDSSIVYIGRINRHKGIDIAAAACEKLSVKLHIYGGLGLSSPQDQIYNDLNFLRPLISRYSNTLYYRGPVNCALEKQTILSSANAVIIPSIEPESCSLLAIEAAYHNTPVAALHPGGIVEYLGGHLVVADKKHVAMDQESALADAVYRAMSKSEVEPVNLNSYSSAAMANRYINWWKSV